MKIALGTWLVVTLLFVWIGRLLIDPLTHWLGLTVAGAWLVNIGFAALISLMPAAEVYSMFRPHGRRY